MKLSNYPVDGKYGKYGGRFVPEVLMEAISELEQAYDKARKDPEFQKQLDYYLSEFVGRPTPLYLAENLTRKLGGAKIYLKREDLAHGGAHKINNTIGQALLAKRMGKTRIIAETGAGQHGVATAIACAALGLKAEVYMGTEDCERQRLNVFRMKLLNAQVHPVETGSKTLKDSINEAFRDWVTNLETTYYLIGSVVGPHPYPMIVRDFQSVIGNEIKEQFKQKEGGLPDALVACVGGGSNAMGTFYPFEDDTAVKLYGVEAAGEGIETGKHAASLARRSRRRLPRHANLRAPRQQRTNPEHQQRLSRLRLPRRWTRTLLPENLQTSRICFYYRQRSSRCLPDIVQGRRNFASVGIFTCSSLCHEACAEDEENPINRDYIVWARRQRR